MIRTTTGPQWGHPLCGLVIDALSHSQKNRLPVIVLSRSNAADAILGPPATIFKSHPIPAPSMKGTERTVVPTGPLFFQFFHTIED